MNNETLYSIALRSCYNIGDYNYKKIIDFFGSAEIAWSSPKKEFHKIVGIGVKTSSDIGNAEHLRFAEKEIEFCLKHNINIHLRQQNSYPSYLSQCDDAPAIIYQKGNYNDNLKPISIFGTRNITSYGKQFLEELISALKTKNIITISGLAYGVDASAHQLSLEHNIPTLAVLAHGLHMLYPAKHKKLADQIINNEGALLSEFNSTQQPDRERFIQRNRIIAGLSPVNIVVESAFGGGSMSTVTFANDYNRDVFALPGKITDKYSQGCNLLISQNKAECIVNVKDLLDKIIIESTQQLSFFNEIDSRPSISGDALIVFNIIKSKSLIHLEEIMALTDKASYLLLPILLDLELNSYIKSFAGRQYEVIN